MAGTCQRNDRRGGPRRLRAIPAAVYGRLLFCITLATLAVACLGQAALAQTMHVYVGTYTRGESQGIYLFAMDSQTGKLTSKGLAGEAVNPSFLAIHPDGKRLYAVGEVASFDGQKSGAVNAFRIDPATGRLEPINQQASGGPGACHLNVDLSGKCVLVANYSGGSVAVLPLKPDGGLGQATAFIQHEGSSVDPRRQQGPHAHSVNLDASGRFAFVADLGLDRIMIYRFDADRGTLTPNDPPWVSVAPGAGPRHFAFHPSGKYAYVINEMLSTVTAFGYNAERGELREIETVSTLPPIPIERNYTAEVQVHPSGKFLYGSNRGHDSIAVFAIDASSGKLTPVGHEPTRGKTPRNFAIDPTGRFLLAANQDAGNVVVFRIDQETGRLEATGDEVNVGSPVCVKFLATDG